MNKKELDRLAAKQQEEVRTVRGQDDRELPRYDLCGDRAHRWPKFRNRSRTHSQKAQRAASQGIRIACI